MSLTEHVNDRTSPVWRWFDREVRTAATRRLVATINTHALDLFPPIRGYPASDPMIVGAAVDYGVRWEVGLLDPRAALLGAARLRFVWPAAEAIVRAIVAAAADGTRRERCALQLRLPYAVLDGIPVPVMTRCRGNRHRCCASEVGIGCGGSDRDWYYGVRWRLTVAPQGLITGWTLGAGATEERWVADAVLG